jgi:hypothetical protein
MELVKETEISQERKDEIIQLCSKYSDIFKLEGDKLTSTLAPKHYILTPNIPRGRAITLKNY